MGWVLSVHAEDANNPAHVSEELKRLVHNFLAAVRAQGHRVKAADLASTTPVQLGAQLDAPPPAGPPVVTEPPPAPVEPEPAAVVEEAPEVEEVEDELPPEARPSPPKQA